MTADWDFTTETNGHVNNESADPITPEHDAGDTALEAADDDRPWPGDEPDPIGAREAADIAAAPAVANGSSYSRYKPSESNVQILDGPAIAAPLPELAYLVREIGLVSGGGAPHLVAGYGFSGKTLALQAMALSLAAARTVWGAYLCRDARRVLHVDFEQGQRLTCRRYQRLARATGIDLATLGDALAVAVMPPGLALTEACATRWHELMVGRDLVVVDSLRAATGGQDENSSDIRAGLDMLGHVSEQTGCRALIIHHARKPSEDSAGGQYAIRGSSGIFDACDSAYLFSAAKDEPVSVDHVKARTHGDLVDSFALTISDVILDGDPRAGLGVQVHGHELVEQRRATHEKEARQAKARTDALAVRAAIATTPGIKAMELRGVTGLSGDRFAAAIVALGSQINVVTDLATKGRPASRHYLAGAS